MANLLLTNACNQRCPYCFASSVLRAADPRDAFISAENFERYLDFLDRSEIDQARLLGGEPTLHPQFADFVKKARQRGKKLVVFSNGLCPQAALDALAEIPPEECSVLVNVTPLEDGEPAATRARQFATLQQLGFRARLGYTIYHSHDAGLSGLISLIETSGCSRSIRVGLAHPSQNTNTSVHPKQYASIAAKVVAFAEEAEKYGISIELDCGFVRCMFSQADMDTLKRCKAHTAWHCSPVVDIDIHGTAMACFPLGGVRQIEQALEQTAAELVKTFEESLAYYRIAGVYAECSSCNARITENCSGGCLSAAMNRMKHPSFVYELPAPYGEEFKLIPQNQENMDHG